MRLTIPILALLAGLLPLASAAAPGIDRADQIRARLHDANHWRGHVMVVAHRAGWKENGRPVRAENSRAAIDNAAALGVEIVELDVRRSADGALVVMHDHTLDRTTTCRGAVADYTLARLRTCRLVVEGTGEVTAEVVPTLAEMLGAAKGRVFVNIDNKLEPQDLPAIAAEARAIGMADGILIKNAVWNADRVALTRTVVASVGSDVSFMPIIADDAVRDVRFMATTAQAFAAPAAELITWRRDARLPVTTDGGPLFSAKARAAAIRGNWHMWVNTYPITNRPDGMVAGGRGDGVAFVSHRPDEVFGFWIDRGATIIQTDEPKALLHWLDGEGYRTPYDDLTN
ncbi:glycerophosphodiester phosphodiesterase family protein [Rhizobium sp. TRM95111]|uniref:glycerophosphodiester phosphodiesterase family protein n=1 Tax=Rhizobium alarense TaxID=2846851 RepID=UPI001F336E64|nr:glycerophosphodiester phosphodiesterase family protein [Rhizobium alarense]MCF3641981.1 glycerophosphodiester phosphodiesterase family protein [Rhizobium alarense]